MASGRSVGKILGITDSSTQSVIVPVSICRTELEPWAPSESEQSFAEELKFLRLDTLGETSVNFGMNFQLRSVSAQEVCIFATFLSFPSLLFSSCADNILRSREEMAEAAG